MIEELTTWLHRHSTSVVREGTEFRFFHATGSTSILVVRDAWVDDTVPVKNDQLAAFYAEYWAASIGDGHVIIGTPVRGGIEITHGYRIPDLEEMAAIATSVGTVRSEDFQIFMMEASWMFIYGVSYEPGPIVLYDRDYEEFTALTGIEELLNRWWEIEGADAPETVSPQ